MRTSPRKKAVLNKTKLAAYAATGVTAALCGANSADADITHVVVGVVVNDPVSGGGGTGINLPLGDFASYDIGLAHFFYSTNGGGIAAASNFFAGNGASVAGFFAGFNYASNVASGAPISGLPFLAPNVFMTMAYFGGYGNDQFLAPGTGFLGVRFNGGNQYGWIRVNMDGAPLNSFTVVDYAWADAGESINAGQTSAIPEPGALGALALGAVGLLGWRQSRRKSAA